MLRIEYESEGFPAGGPVTNGYATLKTSWDELLWAAVTVGRPNRQYVFQHGDASAYEALFRWSLTRMALEQQGPRAFRLRRTNAARTLDPTEKGMVNYFLGMTTCKLFTARLLQAPWMMHLDVFRPQLDPILAGRSRPDLVGQTSAGDWIAMEAKGRVSAPNADAKNKAKQQALRLIAVQGTPPSFHIGAIMYFRNDVLQFFWRDPRSVQREPPNPVRLPHDDALWKYYYQPVYELIHLRPDQHKRMLAAPMMMRLDELDIEVGVLPEVLQRLTDQQWGAAKEWCTHHLNAARPNDYQADGIRVTAGPSWLKPYEEGETA